MAVAIAYVGNTNNIELQGLKSDIEDTFINNASPTVTIKDADGNEVAPTGAWPITMTYIDASDGNYYGPVSADVEFVDGQTYTAFIDVDASDTSTERKGHWEMPIRARVRTA